MISALLAPRSARCLSALALLGCAGSPPPDLESPAPSQAIRILAASRTPASARLTLALSEPAHVTVFSVVPGEAVGLLRPSGEGAKDIAPALGAGSHVLSLIPAGAGVAAPQASGAPNFQDPMTYESCISQVMAKTFNQNVPDRQAALDNPYYACADRPAPAAAAPARRPAYVLVVTTSGVPDAAALARELDGLDLSGSIGALGNRVGALVARSTGEASPTFTSATSRW